jgi:hypothetical protein
LNAVNAEVELGASLDSAIATAGVPEASLAEAREEVSGKRGAVADTFDLSIELQPSEDNRNHARSAMRVALAFWGDAPLSTITTESVIDLLLFARRLPVNHGRKHGKNARAKTDKALSKRDEIAAADAEFRAEVERMDIARREKDALIANGLRPRLNTTTLKKLHAFVRRAINEAIVHRKLKREELPPVF